MKLIIFDIDGTILDSVNTDDRCFIQTFYELFEIDLSRVDWNDFKNVTDQGVTTEIFKKWFNRTPKRTELEIIKIRYKRLLEQSAGEITEIEQALSFINKLSNEPDYQIAFATGGWRETAYVKCNAIGLDPNDFIFKSSSDHYIRSEIIKLAIKEAKDKNGNEAFESILYFGDGLWDLKATQELGIDFIGVDYKGNNALRNVGVRAVISNYREPDNIMSLIQECILAS